VCCLWTPDTALPADQQDPVDQARIWSDLDQLDHSADKNTGVAAVTHFIKLAHLAPPLHQHVDKKKLHDIHSYRSTVTGKTEKIRRFRKGDIRVLHYACDDGRIILINVVAKRSDTLTRAQKNEVERRLDNFLSASLNSNIKWTTRPEITPI